MKKSLAIASIALLGLLGQSNLNAYGSAGCGLGSLIIKEDGFIQIFAATTNGTSGSQTFGITTGTSNCTSSGVVKNEKAREVFVHLNYESLEKEMAVGKGEKLDTLATLFGCSKNKSDFSKLAQKNFDKLFSEDSTPIKMVSVLSKEVANDDSLKSSCSM